MNETDALHAVFASAIAERLRQQQAVLERVLGPPKPLSPQQKARIEWMHNREQEAYALAPWLEDVEPW